MRRTVKRIAIVTATAALVLGGAGIAYAAWNVHGTGSASTKATSAQELSTLDVSAVAAGQLYPGGSADVVIKISNPNKFPVRVTSVTGNGAITGTGGSGECATTGVSFADQVGVAIDIAAEGSTQATFTGAAAMNNSSDNGCQGATFTIPVAISGASNAA